MHVFEKVALGAGLVVVGITAIYRHILSDEQRQGFAEAYDVIQKATREVTDTVSPLVSDGPTKTEEEEAAALNRARTAAQWEALGY